MITLRLSCWKSWSLRLPMINLIVFLILSTSCFDDSIILSLTWIALLWHACAPTQYRKISTPFGFLPFVICEGAITFPKNGWKIEICFQTDWQIKTSLPISKNYSYEHLNVPSSLWGNSYPCMYPNFSWFLFNLPKYEIF